MHFWGYDQPHAGGEVRIRIWGLFGCTHEPSRPEAKGKLTGSHDEGKEAV
jgi:hypothetical protein